MRIIISTVCLVASLLSSATLAAARDYIIAFDQLPAASQTFVSTHFANVQVAGCVRDSHSYEVRLTDATELEFNLNGTWKEVDCKYKEIPASVTALLPKTIPAYVKTNFPTVAITKVNSKVWGYELELSNGFEVEFDTTGQFLKIDD